MFNSQYYTCEQIDQRLLQGYLDDYNSQNNTNLTKEQFLTLLFNTIGRNSTVDNIVTQIGYYECDTAGATAAKAITVANYNLFAGGSMKVKFVNKNTANNATLNINSQGAKDLYYQGERASATNSWDEGEVVEIYYDGTSYYANNVKGGSGSGVYDVSKEHPTSGPNSDGKFTLEYILNSSNVNELIPVNKRYPGMSIQFVSTFDDKYVQYRLMTQWSVYPGNWQGVDYKITPASKNLAESGAVQKRMGTYNLNLEVEDKNWTLQEAIEAVPANERKKGLIIVYKVDSGWENAQYVYNNPTTASSWENPEAWRKFVNNTVTNAIVNNTNLFNVNNEVENINYTLETAIQAVPTSKRKIGLFVAFKSSNGWVLVQYTYNSPSSPDSWNNTNAWRTYVSNNITDAIINNTNLFNVNNEVENINYTLETAIHVVPVQKRKIGLFITFKSSNGWVLAQYTYNNPTATTSWENTEAWIVYGTTSYTDNSVRNATVAFNLNTRVQDKVYTFSEARNAVPQNERKKGLIITYKIADAAWRTEQLQSNIPATSQYWDADSSWMVIEKGRAKAFVIAAYDSSDNAKASADLVAAENGGIDLINTVINSLTNGGKIYLLNGTYTGTAGVALTKSNIVIEGESFNAKIQRTSGNDIFANIDGISGCVIRNISFSKYNFLATSGVIFDNCNINNNVNSLNNLRKVIRVTPNEGIAGINAAINTLTVTYGGKIILDPGVYEGNTYVNFVSRGNNIIISGAGKGTIIRRTTSGNDVIIPDNSKGLVIENLTLNTGFNKYPNREPVRHCRFNNVYVGDKYINDAAEEKINIINVGQGYYFGKLSEAYSLLNSNIRIYPNNGIDYRWEIHIYGHVVETAAMSLGYPNVDLIGHNAVVEFNGNKGVNITFAGSGLGSSAVSKTVTISNIKFLKTGCYSYWDEGCAVVKANGYKFVNCIFENQSSSPVPFNQADNENITDTTTGARRHGIEIDIFNTDNRYATEFHNCIGIGSPYGFQNTRGWYISFGSPRLFNCVGIGGGIGLYGHGILMHRGSTPELHDCVGYGSKWGYNDNAGIRFQAMGQGTLVGCVGYGSNAKRYLSNGVSAARITEICTALGLNPSTYVVDGQVQYSLLTDEICAELTNADVDIQPTGVPGGKGVGISFWSNNGAAKLIDCVGYAGNGQYSAGLECNRIAEPIVQGGYYGVEDRTFNFQWDSTKNYNNIKIDSPNVDEYTPLLLTRMVVSIVDNFNGLTLHVVKSGTGGFDIASLDLSGIASIGIINILNGEIGANAEVKFYFTNSSNQTVQPPSSPYFHIGYCFNNNTRGLSLLQNSHPKVDGATFKTDSTGSSVYIDTDSNDYQINRCLLDTYGGDGIDTNKTNIKMYDCCIKGSVDNSITFASKTAINGSSNYN